MHRNQENFLYQFLKMVQNIIKKFWFNVFDHINAGNHLCRGGVFSVLWNPDVIPLIGKLWPESTDNSRLISFGNGAIAFFVAVALILIFKAF